MNQSVLMFFIKLLTKCVEKLATYLQEAKPKTSSQPALSNLEPLKQTNRLVNFYYCQSSDESCPLAIARFTVYDRKGKVLCVEQITYEEDDWYFEQQIISALRCKVDIAILSAYHPSRFSTIQQLRHIYTDEDV